MRYTVIVWDDRDIESDEQSSQVGVYFDEQEAKKELENYLKTEHGSHIYRTEIISEE